ncbi:hypothetical protein BASA50_006025 [Batrachochytrium salamandrivorans]|uniref:Vacuolar fusion protein MON1 n=1 Tax=Batrachochytrium salamandrivorans TaxID=1357716 RepID=A0ABQ8FEB6_9FUNG|nr:hypothetical protein BASA50_006025 [Batrachochytrium salamandrivorans]
MFEFPLLAHHSDCAAPMKPKVQDAVQASAVVEAVTDTDVVSRSSTNATESEETTRVPIYTINGTGEQTMYSEQSTYETRQAAMSAFSLLEEDTRPSHRDGYQRKHGNQGSNSPIWRNHKKHFFILSAAGKPIYTRYGDETKLSSFMGVIQVVIAYFSDEGDTLRSIRAGDHLFVFQTCGPLHLVAVSCTGENEYQLRCQLDMLFNQIAMTLTVLQLDRIFEQRVNYDLRNLLSGTEKFMDTLATSFQRDSSVFLESIQSSHVPMRIRDRVTQTLLSSLPPKQLLFGMLFAKDRLITLLRPRNYTLHPKDVLLLHNMILSSSAFRTVESWTPVCLPHFNHHGFLHAYVCFITPDLCLALLSAEKDAFFVHSDYKGRVVTALTTLGVVPELDASLPILGFSVLEMSIPGLRHCIVKSRTLGQFVEPLPIAPYTRSQDLKRLRRLYQYGLELCTRKLSPHRMACFTTGKETVVCQTSDTTEIYAAFGPLARKDVVLSGLQELRRWARNNEESLFMNTAPLLH